MLITSTPATVLLAAAGCTPALLAGQPLERPLKIKFWLLIAGGRGRALRRLLLLLHSCVLALAHLHACPCCSTTH